MTICAMDDTRVQRRIRLPEDLIEWLEREAQQRDVSVNHLVTVACRRYRQSEEGT